MSKVGGYNEVLQQEHYYPFGMGIRGEWKFVQPQIGGVNQYLYNGKELNDDFGLNWNDYGARWYDSSIGRWGGVDPLAEDYVGWSGYNYVMGNPIRLVDPDGMRVEDICPNCVAAGIGAAIGGGIGAGFEIVAQLRSEGKISDWSAIGGSMTQGAVTGGAAGFTMGASFGTTVVVSAGSNVVGGIANRAIQGQGTTGVDMAVDAAVGGAFGAVGHKAGEFAEQYTNNLTRHQKGKLGEAITEMKYGTMGYKSSGKAKIPTGGKTKTGRPQKAFYDHDMENVFTGKRLTVESKFNTSPLSKNQRAAQSNIGTPGGLIVDRTTSQQLGNATKAGVIGAGGQIGTRVNQYSMQPNPNSFHVPRSSTRVQPPIVKQ